MQSQFIGKELEKTEKREGKVGWRSPSNIAIIKYWGKHGNQLPRNPSISFTLSNAFTETIVEYEVQEYSSDQLMLDFYFEGQPNEAFGARVRTFLEKNLVYFPFLKNLHLSIDSHNSFPHSSGIASSASSMSALCLCLTTLESELTATDFSHNEFIQKASFISRLASGSACRSVYAEAAIWGSNNTIDASDVYAVPYQELHPIFKTMHDDILIVSKEEKKVSSTAGHALMEGNPFSETRYALANARFEELLTVLRKGHMDAFGKIAEDEALTLHALMMCSDPSYILLEPNTLAIIAEIRRFRKEKELPLYFTLDAGPNIHLLYPDSIHAEAQEFIQNNLLQYCDEQKIIKDIVGAGPTEINSFTLTD